MSEQYIGPEHQIETLSQDELAPKQEQPVEAPEAAEKAKHEQLVEARETVSAIEPTKNPLEDLQAAEKAAEPAQPTFVNRELKGLTLQRELRQLRRKLPAPQRALSKVIHQPAIRAVSEAAGKTVSRPSGLLGGGLVALLGTSAYLYLARHIGFKYNYAVFLVLFIGGFIVGLGLELLVWLATRARRGDS